MAHVRLIAGAIALLATAVGCASNRYVSKNGGAPQYDVRFVNTCSRFAGHLYLDDEYANRRKIDVKARFVGTKPVTVRLAQGPHRYYVEFREFEETKFKQGTFVVRGAQSFEMC